MLLLFINSETHATGRHSHTSNNWLGVRRCLSLSLSALCSKVRSLLSICTINCIGDKDMWSHRFLGERLWRQCDAARRRLWNFVCVVHFKHIKPLKDLKGREAESYILLRQSQRALLAPLTAPEQGPYPLFTQWTERMPLRRQLSGVNVYMTVQYITVLASVNSAKFWKK